MAINAGTISAELVLKADGFFKNLSKADSETQSLQSKLKGFGDKASSVGKSLTTKLSLPIAGVGAAAALLGLNFDSAMSEVQAISGATGEDMVKLEAIAREMGATTKFSAQDAADGLKYMAMAGWETNEMMDALPGVLALAAASGEDLGLTSDIVTDSLTGFGMAAGDATKFADLLASASSNSNTNVSLMGETFKYVAPLFGALGYSAEDAALATGLMANAGIKGSQAGTTLRAAITNLVKPTDAAAAVMKELGISTTDANGEMKPFDVLLGDLRSSFGNLTEEQKAQKAATLFGKEAMSGMLAIINASEEDYNKLTDATTNYNGAATEMAEIMEGNLKGKINNIKSALEEAGLKIYNIMLPAFEALADKIQVAIDWFNGLDESTQANIVKWGLFAAAIGPVLLVVGTLAGALSNIIGVVGLFTGATAAAGGVAGAGALSVGLAGVVTAAAPFIAGLGLATAAGVAISKALKEEVVPEVDLFADKIEVTGDTMENFAKRTTGAVETTTTVISEGTKNAVSSYLDMEKDIKASGEDLLLNHTRITEEIKADMENKYNEMNKNVIQSLNDKKTEEIRIQTELFRNVSALTKDEQAKILQSTEKHYFDEQNKLEIYQRQIMEIYDKAKNEHRELKQEELTEISRLENEMKTLSIKALSETEAQSKVILERMKASDERITAEMASDRIIKLNELRDQAIASAEETYDGHIEAIIRMRDETGTITADQADAMIKDAERQRDGTIQAAESTRTNAVREIFRMNKELKSSVDSSSGEILTTWGKLKNWWDSWKPGSKLFTGQISITETVSRPGSQNNVSQNPSINAHGTEFFGGGYTWVGEQGRELIKAPRGSKILSNPKSEELLGSGKGITQNITINSPKHLSPSETARKYKQASRQLATEW